MASEIPESAARAYLQPPEGREWEDCDDCDATGEYTTADGSVAECETCDGEGAIPPPTREEIAEEKAEREFDRMRDEGEA